jgi:hypothetical protein
MSDAVQGPQADEEYVAHMKQRDQEVAAFFAEMDAGSNPDPARLKGTSGA